MGYYIGIDGGGTQSRLLAVDAEGGVCGRALGKSTNLASNPRKTVQAHLEAAFADFFAQSGYGAGDCEGLCIGSAGLDFDNNCSEMEEIIRALGFSCPILAVNDGLLVLAAATEAGSGVAVVSGTGSVAYGMNDRGEIVRCGGWGHLIDDGGSGYWIGREGLRRALRAFDGAAPPTLLTESLRRVWEVKQVPELIAKVYGSMNKADIAALAAEVSRGAALKDQVCIDILEDAAEELFVLADTCLRRLALAETDVVVSGGAISHIPLLFQAFDAKMRRNYTRVHLSKFSGEPAMGAVHLAMRKSRIC